MSYLIYTDASWDMQARVGVAAAVVTEGGILTEVAQVFELGFPPNYLEFIAIVLGLEKTPEGCSAIVYSDSLMALKIARFILSQEAAMRRVKWQGWKKKLIPLALRRSVAFEWVKGHDLDPLNTYVDELARRTLQQARKERGR